MSDDNKNNNSIYALIFVVIILLIIAAFVTAVNKIDLSEPVDVIILSPLESNGAVPVNIQDQHTHVVETLLSQAVGAPMSLVLDTVIGNYTLTVSPGHSFVAGNELFIVEEQFSFHALIISVSGDELTLNQPIDKVYTTNGLLFEVSSKLNVDGSTTPEEFTITLGSSATISLDITGIRFVITDGVDMDDGKFGGISALTRGIVFQQVHADGTHNLWTAKTNGKLRLLMNHVEYSDKAPADAYGFSATWKISEDNGVTLRLDPGDSIKLIVQDDLTGLTSFKALVYGHYVTD